MRTFSKLNLQNRKGHVDMCEAIRDMRNDAIAEGEQRGVRKEALTIAKNLIALGSNCFE